MSSASFGSQLGHIVVEPPGPNSRRLATLLRRYESRNITYVAADWPIFWSRAAGANVKDVDQNIYVDVTAAFGVAAAGHSNKRVAEAIARQARRLLHGMGDVHPTENKVALAKMLCEMTPGNDEKRVIFASTGSEAIEAALKSAAVASAKPGVLCFTGAYHGLTYGALSVTDRVHFKQPFERQLGDFAVRAPYPNKYRWPGRPTEDECAAASLDAVREILDGAQGKSIGAVIVEAVQGRGGDVPAPISWLQALRQLCDQRELVLIVDEIYTGFGRTGRWFACDRAGIVPDIICVGKGLSSGFPIAACIGSAQVMDCWPETSGEAIHTSTFLGHPTGCEAALASIAELRDAHLVSRAASLEPEVHERLQQLAVSSSGSVGDVRGCGLMWGIEFVDSSQSPDPAAAQQLLIGAMRRGLLLLNCGPQGNVVSFSPPLVITRDQLEFSFQVLHDLIGQFSRAT